MYKTSQIKAGGVWRGLLITDTPEAEKKVTESWTDSNGDEVAVIFYIDGLCRTVAGQGTLLRWYLYNTSRVTVNGETSGDAAAALEEIAGEVGV